MLVLVIRPAGEAAETAAAVEALGHAALIDPVMVVEQLETGPVPLDGAAALLVTSRHGVPGLPGADLGLPVFAVGPATAAAARAAGWSDVREGPGDGAGLARLLAATLPAGARLVHVSGADVRPGLAEGLAAAGFDYRRHVGYRAVLCRDLGSATRAALAERWLDAVLLFSPRSATHWASLVRRDALAGTLDEVSALCLSPAIAEAVAGIGWRGIEVAARCDQAALLDRLAAVALR
jgi:uroporphyrinogen-III synthase